MVLRTLLLYLISSVSLGLASLHPYYATTSFTFERPQYLNLPLFSTSATGTASFLTYPLFFFLSFSLCLMTKGFLTKANICRENNNLTKIHPGGVEAFVPPD